MKRKWGIKLLLTVLLGACSQVQLNYGLSEIGQTPLNSDIQKLEPAVEIPTELANLSLLAQVRTDTLDLDTLRLRLKLTDSGQQHTLRSLELSLPEFLQNPQLLWQGLAPGEAHLDVSLLGVDDQILSQINTTLTLSSDSLASVNFSLFADAAGQAQLQLQNPTVANPSAPSANATDTEASSSPQPLPASSAKPASERDPVAAGLQPQVLRDSEGQYLATWQAQPQAVAYEVRLDGQVVDAAVTTSSVALGDLAPDSSHRLEITPIFQNGQKGETVTQTFQTGPADSDLSPQVLQHSEDSLTVHWDTAGIQADHYRLFLNGQVVEESAEGPVYRFRHLQDNQNYELGIQPVLSDGTRLPVQVLDAKTDRSSGGGGGGGGGSAPNTPPVIDDLVASKTTVSGLGYPVQLTATVHDDQNLPDSAYTWTCNDCGDASFDHSDGSQVIWTAPSTPGSYEIQVSVDDGHNPPVTRTQVLEVLHQTADVTVIGDYQ